MQYNISWNKRTHSVSIPKSGMFKSRSIVDVISIQNQNKKRK